MGPIPWVEPFTRDLRKNTRVPYAHTRRFDPAGANFRPDRKLL